MPRQESRRRARVSGSLPFGRGAAGRVSAKTSASQSRSSSPPSHQVPPQEECSSPCLSPVGTVPSFCPQPAGSARWGWWQALRAGRLSLQGWSLPVGQMCLQSIRLARTEDAPGTSLLSAPDSAQLIPTLLSSSLGWLKGPLLGPPSHPCQCRSPLCSPPITLPCSVFCKNTSHCLE